MKFKLETVHGGVKLLDPSDYRPDHKDIADFRNYKDGNFIDRVKKTYWDMHTHQCFKFVEEKKKQWLKFDHIEMSIMEALALLNTFIDESDPDIGLPNAIHGFQTAERIRQTHPNEDWFHLIGLIHDLGKVMAMYGEPQWAVVGDTFPVGCAFSDTCVFGKESFAQNLDYHDPIYSTKLGIYKDNCGLDNVTMSWGHDEYLYQVLKYNNTTLPAVALDMVRYHSFYPWHTGKGYKHLCNEKDMDTIEWVLEFNTFDLYSKCEVVPDINELTPYYQTLIDKYVPGTLKW